MECTPRKATVHSPSPSEMELLIVSLLIAKFLEFGKYEEADMVMVRRRERTIDIDEIKRPFSLLQVTGLGRTGVGPSNLWY
jgi:hypothetical protein